MTTPDTSGSGSARRRPAPRTSGWSAPRCSTGPTPGTPAAPSCSASRTPTPQRDSAESYAAILDALRWLGLDWDEGPEVGGPYAPYRQSRARRASTATWHRQAARGRRGLRGVLDAGGGRGPPRRGGPQSQAGLRQLRPRPDRRAARRVRAPRAASPCCACGCPTRTSRWNDLVRGPTTFAAGTVPDFAITRGSGDPLYTLVNPVDDALMKITHVLRGEDILPSTPRQIALYQALIRIGVAERVPEFAHLPSVLGDGNKKLSKRDPQSNLFLHRDRGFIPEGLLNYLALLGWGIADDHDVFSLDEMVAAFDVGDVNSNPARFDQKKADAINAEHIRLLSEEDFAARLRDVLRRARPRHRSRRRRLRRGGRAGADPHRGARRRVGSAEVPRRRRVTRSTRRPRPRNCGPEAAPVLDAAVAALEAVPDWTTPAHRGGAEDRADRRPRAQAAQGVRPDPGGRHRFVGEPAAVRVAGTARPRPQPGRLRAGRDHAAAATRRREKAAPKSLVVCSSARRRRSAASPRCVRAEKQLVTSGYRQPMGYGVIGNTAVSGTAILGSSPGTPA